MSINIQTDDIVLKPANNYSGHLLRNFQVDYLNSTVPSFFDDPDEFKKLRRIDTGESTWQSIADIINNKKKEGFDDSDLENALFEQLVYSLPDNHYIFHLSTDTSIEQILQKLKTNNPTFDKPIYNNNLDVESLQIASIRSNQSEIIILFRAGFTKDEGDKKTIFFVPCILDFANKLCIIKIRDRHRSKSRYKIGGLLHRIKEIIDGLSDSISLHRYNKNRVYETLYKMFKDESDKAEAIIKKHSTRLSETELNSLVEDFINEDLKLVDVASIKSYKERVKSIYYQDEAASMSPPSFKNRYMFAFSFFDGISTKSSTRDSARSHVYNKKLYWTLKDLIHDEKKISEVSMYYKFDSKHFDNEATSDIFTSVEVTFKESNNVFLIDFYLGSRDTERRIKSEYVIQELKKYLPE